MEHPRISRNPDVMVGKACIKGTRLTVEHILRGLSKGSSISDMLENYPRLTREDVLAAMAYAADRIEHEGRLAA